MRTRDSRREFVYHSPQYPGYTCWTGLYTMPDESVMCCFTQATGPFKNRPRAPEAARKALDWPPVGRQGEFGFDRATEYYPRSVQMANGEVLIVGRTGGDNGYGTVDQSITAVRFFVDA